MSVVDLPGIVCPRCQAIYLTRRQNCSQCGETIPTIEINQETSTSAVAERYGIKKDEGRRISRKEVSIPAVTMGHAGSVTSDINVENICESGLLFKSTQQYTEGDRVRLRLSVNGRQFSVTGVVRRLTPVLDPIWRFSCGLEFECPDLALLLEISKLPDFPAPPASERPQAA